MNTNPPTLHLVPFVPFEQFESCIIRCVRLGVHSGKSLFLVVASTAGNARFKICCAHGSGFSPIIFRLCSVATLLQFARTHFLLQAGHTKDGLNRKPWQASGLPYRALCRAQAPATIWQILKAALLKFSDSPERKRKGKNWANCRTQFFGFIRGSPRRVWRIKRKEKPHRPDPKTQAFPFA